MNLLSFFGNGSGGGASGRAMVFCLSKPGWSWLFRKCYLSIIAGHWAISQKNGYYKMLHTLPSSFTFPIN